MTLSVDMDLMWRAKNMYFCCSPFSQSRAQSNVRTDVNIPRATDSLPSIALTKAIKEKYTCAIDLSHICVQTVRPKRADACKSDESSSMRIDKWKYESDYRSVSLTVVEWINYYKSTYLYRDETEVLTILIMERELHFCTTNSQQ